MEKNIAGILSLTGLLVMIGIWYIFIFATDTEGLSKSELFIGSFSGADSSFFIGSIVSSALCVVSASLFFYGKVKIGVVIVATHALGAVFLYSWVLIAVICLPLLFAPTVWKSA